MLGKGYRSKTRREREKRKAAKRRARGALGWVALEWGLNTRGKRVHRQEGSKGDGVSDRNLKEAKEREDYAEVLSRRGKRTRERNLRTHLENKENIIELRTYLWEEKYSRTMHILNARGAERQAKG